jgi:erythronate-4-phosphate dehydrogenase
MKIVVDRQLLESIQPRVDSSVEWMSLDDYDRNPGSHTVDGFILRSITKVREHTYPTWVDTPPSFVITATAGLDHLDTQWLESLGIQWRHCPGANARAVAEYVVAALLWMTQGDFTGSLGIVGVGATGQAVEKLALDLGWQVVPYDPPRERREASLETSTVDSGRFISASMEELMKCDAATFHVPRVETGQDPTYPLWGQEELFASNASWIIQASRGGIIEEGALYDWATKGGKLACDVWEGEPLVNQPLLEASTIATPHIAGYSYQARSKAITQVLHHLASFGIPCTNTPTLEGKSCLAEVDSYSTCSELVEILHPWMGHAEPFKKELLETYLNQGDRVRQKEVFRQWRTQTPLRTEFSEWMVRASDHQTFPWLTPLGVQIAR